MKALLIIIFVLFVIGLLPVGIDGGYNAGGFKLYVRIGAMSLRVVPAGRLMSKFTEPKAKKAEKPKPRKPQTPEPGKTTKKKPQMTKDDIFDLIKLALKTLGRFRRKLTVDYLRIHITIAANDPFKTAMGYGAANAALSSAIPMVEKAFNITERDFGTDCDFLAEKTEIDFWLTTSIQIWEILYVALATGIDFLKQRKDKKRAAKECERTTTERNDTNGKTSSRRPDGDNSQQDKGNGGREHRGGRSHNNA